jgi:MoaA/NifB/PqqE/SkfB family radical SAM enzyme
MKLSGVHLLLTYQCTFECDHCFVWGSPRQKGTMTLQTIRRVLDEAARLGTVDWVYFEGGEPLLFHPVLVRAVDEAVEKGFRVGLVSNAYWATSPEMPSCGSSPSSGRSRT